MAEEIFFHEYLYDSDAVDAATEAYGGIVEIETAREDEGIKVTLTNIPEEHAGVLKDAFCNHVLYETIVRVRAEAGEGVL